MTDQDLCPLFCPNRCEYYKAFEKRFPRYDCPLVCDDGCVYDNDCATGTPYTEEQLDEHMSCYKGGMLYKDAVILYLSDNSV
jgi:hypothetical protein